MRRRVYVVVIVTFVTLGTCMWSSAESDASVANKKQEIRAADSLKPSAGFAGGDLSSSEDESNLSLTANKHRPRTRKDPRGGLRSAVDRWIQERA